MAQSISVKPAEQGTAIVTISPTDEDDTAISFGDLSNPQWQLMRTDGTVVNGRTFAASSMTSLEVVLSGDDLAMFGATDSGKRIFSFYAKYDSSAGSGFPLVAEGAFVIDKMTGQVDSTS